MPREPSQRSQSAYRKGCGRHESTPETGRQFQANNGRKLLTIQGSSKMGISASAMAVERPIPRQRVQEFGILIQSNERSTGSNCTSAGDATFGRRTCIAKSGRERAVRRPGKRRGISKIGISKIGISKIQDLHGKGKDQHRSILLTALRATLKRLEQSEKLTPNDPVLRTIKSSILRTIARRDLDANEDKAA